MQQFSHLLGFHIINEKSRTLIRDAAQTLMAALGDADQQLSWEKLTPKIEDSTFIEAFGIKTRSPVCCSTQFKQQMFNSDQMITKSNIFPTNKTPCDGKHFTLA